MSYVPNLQKLFIPFVVILIFGCSIKDEKRIAQHAKLQIQYADSIEEKYSIQTYTAEKNRSASPILFVTDIKDTLHPLGRETFFVTGCEPGRQEKSEWNIAEFNYYSGLIRYYFVKTKFDHYSTDAFGEGSLYNNKMIETPQFEKIERVKFEIPVENKGFSLTHDKAVGAYFSILEEKLYDKVQEIGGDGALDLCLYTTDYELIETISNRTPYKETDTIETYNAKMMLTATIVKFKDGYYPDFKYLVQEKGARGKHFVDVK